MGGSLKTRPRVRTRGSNGCLTSHVVSIIVFRTWKGDWNRDRVSFARFDSLYLENYLTNVKEKERVLKRTARHASPSPILGHSV